MGKKFNSVLVALVFAALAVFLAVDGADAFCVYNNTDIYLNVNQKSGGDFGEALNPGEKKCCNWKNKGCNKGGKRDSTVKFVVFFAVGQWFPVICEDFPIKAGGWLTVEGQKPNYKCVRHDY